jgi:hypothetical protein
LNAARSHETLLHTLHPTLATHHVHDRDIDQAPGCGAKWKSYLPHRDCAQEMVM